MRQKKISTKVMLPVVSRQVWSIHFFYPVGKSESVVYTVCIYESTLQR